MPRVKFYRLALNDRSRKVPPYCDDDVQCRATGVADSHALSCGRCGSVVEFTTYNARVHSHAAQRPSGALPLYTRMPLPS